MNKSVAMASVNERMLTNCKRNSLTTSPNEHKQETTDEYYGNVTCQRSGIRRRPNRVRSISTILSISVSCEKDQDPSVRRDALPPITLVFLCRRCFSHLCISRFSACLRQVEI